MSIVPFNQVLVDSQALKDNFSLVAGHLEPSVPLMALVKSDGYGHGLLTAAAAFADAGCLHFGVAEVGEGVLLREAGFTQDIYILAGFHEGQTAYLFSHRLIPAIFSEEDLELVAQAARSYGQKASVYLKFDCGMGRLGFQPSQAPHLAARLKNDERVDVRGVMSHFPCADDRSSDTTEKINALFSEVVQACDALPDLTDSISNSGGTLYYRQTHGRMARAGIALYGYYPDGAAGRENAVGDTLKPALRFVSRVIQVKSVAAGSGISYGHTFIAPTDMIIAVLPVGYSDGYPRNLSNRAEVLVRGRRAPICGRICMNLCMIDVTAIAGVRAGDEVVLLGSQGYEVIDADEIADWAGTISYEILCSLGNTNERYVLETK